MLIGGGGTKAGSGVSVWRDVSANGGTGNASAGRDILGGCVGEGWLPVSDRRDSD